MSKQTLLLIIFLLIITAGLLYLALKGPTISPLNYKPQALITPVNQNVQSVLSFGSLSTMSSSTSAKTTYSLPVLLATNSNKVTAVQLELQYDPQVLTNVILKQGNFFANPVSLINQVDQNTGRVSYALGISPSDQGKMGQGIVATLTFQAKQVTPASTTLVFLPKSLVTAEGSTQSVLKSTSPIKITVGLTPTPTSSTPPSPTTP